MEFKLNKRKVGKQKEDFRKEDMQVAYKFANRLFKEFGNFLKAVVLFGSTARGDKKERDIDLLVIVDDVTIDFTPEVIETYRIIIEKTIVSLTERLHVTSLKFSTFWEYARAGDPVAINILRDGVPLIDSGFFKPLQALLAEGRIRPSPESVWTYFGRAPRTLHNARWHLMQASLDLYWAVVDSAHAALMMLNITPPSPDHVGDLLENMLVSRGLLDPKYVKTMEKFYNLQKKIVYREVKDITGKEFEKLYTEAEDFVNTMKVFIESREFAAPMKPKKAKSKKSKSTKAARKAKSSKKK